MYKIIFLHIFLIFCNTFYGQPLNVATYNLRYDNPADVADTWSARFPHIANIITGNDFDVFGIQEATHAMLNNDLLPLIPAYSYIGEAKYGGQSGEYSAILYKSSKYTVNTSGTFWLSQNPAVVSLGWDAAQPRVCTWGKFTDKATSFSFYYFNTHFDHIGTEARSQSTQLILQKIQAIAGTNPVVFTGDLNLTQFDSNYVKLNNSGNLKSSYHSAINQSDTYAGTFNTFDTGYHSVSRIDHIFLSQHFKVNTYRVITDRYNVIHFPSDHFAVTANVQQKQNENGLLYFSFPEDFDNGAEKSLYAAANANLRTGIWLLDNVVLASQANDRASSGIGAARMQQNLSIPAYLQMNFDLSEGASKVVVWYSSYGAAADGLSKWLLQYSTNSGGTWLDVGDTITAISKTKQQAVISVNISGNVRFRIKKLGLGSNVTNPSIQNGRLSIDDISVFKYNTNVLPVTGLTISALKNYNSVTISWKTLSEINTDRFEVLKADDGVSFKSIATVLAKGSASFYNYNDVGTFAATAYYKIKQLDKDGRFKYSKVVSVDNKPKQSLKVYNSKGFLNITYTSTINKKTTLCIYDVNGRVVMSKNIVLVNSINKITIPHNLINGAYILTINEMVNSVSSKFLINN